MVPNTPEQAVGTDRWAWKNKGLRDKKEGDAAVALGWMVVGVVLGFGWWCLSVFTLDGRNRGVALR